MMCVLATFSWLTDRRLREIAQRINSWIDDAIEMLPEMGQAADAFERQRDEK
jgi:hypothetical protein